MSRLCKTFKSLISSSKKHPTSDPWKKLSGRNMNNIHARLLKDSTTAPAKPLLINRSLAEGCFLSDWKYTSVTPIHKAGSRSTPDAANYRPISTLPVVAKVVGRAVYTMVYSYLQENRFLSIYHFDYRSPHSISTCLTDVTIKLLDNIHKRQLKPGDKHKHKRQA